jgi:hypothetical protein
MAIRLPMTRLNKGVLRWASQEMFNGFLMDIGGFEAWIIAFHFSLLTIRPDGRNVPEPVVGVAEYGVPLSHPTGGPSPGRPSLCGVQSTRWESASRSGSHAMGDAHVELPVQKEWTEIQQADGESK